MSSVEAERLLAGIRSWVEIESQTADVAGVNAAMSKAASDFSGAGARVECIAGTAGRADHLSIRSPWGASDQPCILVLCHLDTVHPKGTLARDLTYRVEGDRAYGPGMYDMKGGAYLVHAALRDIIATGRPTPLPIHMLYVSDEEVGSPTSRRLIEQSAERARYVLVTEPARDGGKIVTARKGVGRYEITTFGRPAHSGARHSDGRSAIVEMARLVLDIEQATDYARGVTFNVGCIAGGTADNVVPAECRATVDLRVRTVDDAARMDTFLRGLKPRNPDVRIVVEGGLNRPPYETTPGGQALFDHARTLAAEIGIDLQGVATGGGSDGNFTAHKVATLDGLGVDGDGAHTHNEHLLVSSLVPRYRLLRRLLETLS